MLSLDAASFLRNFSCISQLLCPIYLLFSKHVYRTFYWLSGKKREKESIFEIPVV
jgi:hypothetical protein